MRQRVLALGAAILAGFMASSAQAAPILGATVIATGGHVIATFEGHTALYSNDLYLESPANGLGVIFNNYGSAPGTSIDLGEFAAGTELIFRVHVRDTGDDFFSGPGFRNLDGIAHAQIDDDVAGSPGRTFVGFEDLRWGGDFDYDDLVFSFTNVRAETDVQEVPEPLMLSLFGIGLAMSARRLRTRTKR
jgi:hypothetical protein